MNISFGLALAALIIGLVLYYAVPNAKTQEVGRLMFATGLLATLLHAAGSASLHING